LLVCLGFIFCVFCHVSFGHFVLVLLAFVDFDLVSSVLSQEIGWEEHLRNDLFCVEWDVNLNSINQFRCGLKEDKAVWKCVLDIP